ncbi:MAG: hypothetical protein QOI47_2668 [Actinomycetota bacterium]|nr:hypothetical protein [Actinomycetota bacterium]
MPTYVVRVWIPDRPGALGAVASRIGAVRGDVVGIDILERGADRAVDELTVELPDEDLVELLVSEIKAVDGVAVEDIRPARDGVRDPRLDALESAATLVEATSRDDLLGSLVRHAVRDFGGDWAAVLDDQEPVMRSGEGPVPEAAWLHAFVQGSSTSEAVASGRSGPDELAWAALPTARLHLVIGRAGRQLRSVERRQVAALARIADSRWSEVV